MSMPYDGAVKEYFDWEIKSWVDIIVNMETNQMERFLPINTARCYFASSNDGKRRNLDNILSDMFNMDFHLIDSDIILRDHTAIFCILLSIGRGRYIEHFACHEELSDQRLPFDLFHPPRHFPTESDSTFLTEFCAAQNRYCVPKFDSHMLHKYFGNQRLLPITSKEPLPTKDSVKAHLIRLYGPYNKMNKNFDKEKTSLSDSFFVKSYSAASGLALYTKEVNAFRSIRNADGIIKFHGSYEHNREAHLLLEYADKSTLDQFFRNEPPPSRGDEIIDFWENIIKLLQGLRAIHIVKDHHNISSENILVLSNGKKGSSKWQFKFSDLGLLSEWRGNSKNLDKSYVSSEEESQLSKLRTAACADIWHLGYVFSEAALWIAEGYKGILEFQQVLAEDIGYRNSKYIDEKCQISERILEALAEIENHLRRSDYVTKDILALLVDEMLWDKDQQDIETLIQRSEDIIAKARRTLAEENSNKGGRRRTLSRNSQWPSSLPPPVPILADEYKSEIPPPKIEGSLFPEKCQDAIVSKPALKRASTFSAYGNNCSYAKNTSTAGNVNKAGSVTPEILNDTQATSWFLESPMSNSSNNLVSEMSAEGSYSQSLVLKQTSELATCLGIERASNSNSTPSMTHVPDSCKAFFAKQAEWKEPFGAQLRGALLTLPSQESRSEFQSSQIFRKNSVSTNTFVDGTAPQYSFSGSSSSGYSRFEPSRSSSVKTDAPNVSCNSRPHTGIDSHHSHHPHSLNLGEKDHYNPSRLSKKLSLTFPTGSSTTSSKCTQESSVNFSTTHSFSTNPSQYTNRSLLTSSSPSKSGSIPGKQSRFINTYSNLSSVLNCKRNSRLTKFGSSILGVNNHPVLSPCPEPIDPYPVYENIGFLGIDTCRHWKQLRKAARKKSQAPLLPDVHLLQSLQDRKHVFIVDDSDSMASYWPEVVKVFEALSYVVKSISPLSIELLYTISNDTRRRRGTHELCNYLSAKVLQRSPTNISERLCKQLDAYRNKLLSPKNETKKMRPMNFYVFTNGLWQRDSEKMLLNTLEQTAVASKLLGVKNCIFISFIGFEDDSLAAESVQALNRSEWQDYISIKWTLYTGNIWEMLRGDLHLISQIHNNGLSTKAVSLDSEEERRTLSHDSQETRSIFRDEIRKTQSVIEVKGIFELA